MRFHETHLSHSATGIVITSPDNLSSSSVTNLLGFSGGADYANDRKMIFSLSHNFFGTNSFDQ